MLIRWATEKDLPAWYALATEVSSIFQHPGDMGADPEFASYAQSKVSKYEALTAVDDMSGQNMGFIAFSRKNNRISWFAVFEKYRNKGIRWAIIENRPASVRHDTGNQRCYLPRRLSSRRSRTGDLCKVRVCR